MGFQPISRTNISDEVVKQIRSMLNKGDLKPGERLPSERQLSEMLKVGRSSVREAMKALEALGIIERKNEGTLISNLDTLDRQLFFLEPDQTLISEVFETRKALETELVALAAERATQDEIRRIGDCIVEAVDTEQARASDVSFHGLIAEAAHNSVFSKVYRMISGLLFQTHKYYSVIEEDQMVTDEEVYAFRKRNLLAHKKILRAIERHDKVGARRAMKQHLEETGEALLKRVESRGRSQSQIE